MNLIKKPFYWVSAHREIQFTFEYDLQYPLTNVVGNDGFAVFIFTGDGINSLAVGDYLYCDTAPYIGYHKVTELLFANWYKTETSFDLGTPVTSGTIYFIQDRVFTLYKGYQSGDLATLLPYTKIAEFKPEPNLDGQLVVNISGYVNKIFDVINSNDTTTVGAHEVYYNLFNQVELLIDDISVSTHMVLNSAITSLELNRDYVDTGRMLNGGSLGNFFPSCGDFEQIIIDGSLVVVGNIYEEGEDVTVGGYFEPTEFNLPDFVTTG